MCNPVIKRLPSKKDVTAWTEELIDPIFADSQSKRLIDLLFAVADPNNQEQWELALAAAQTAYTLTNDFQENFDAFAGTSSVIENTHNYTIKQTIHAPAALFPQNSAEQLLNEIERQERIKMHGE